MKRSTFEKANAAAWDDLERITGELEKPHCALGTW